MAQISQYSLFVLSSSVLKGTIRDSISENQQHFGREVYRPLNLFFFLFLQSWGKCQVSLFGWSFFFGVNW